MSGEARVIKVNGEQRRSHAASLTDLLREEWLDPARRGIAIALDGSVVARAAWADTPLAEGSVVEIVKPAAGG
ncbi:MAG: sulfur carrier protein ThiS [Limibacillus sp.]